MLYQRNTSLSKDLQTVNEVNTCILRQKPTKMNFTQDNL